jgi:hypothetical protein
MRKTAVAGLVAALLTAAPALAQGPITSRMAPATFRGVIVEVTCFRRIAADGRLGILTEGDGLFQITGGFADNKYAKLAAFIGKTVDITGAEVVISNNYDYKSFEASKVVQAKK